MGLVFFKGLGKAYIWEWDKELYDDFDSCLEQEMGQAQAGCWTCCTRVVS
jgi:hypothetical protein